MRLATPSPSVSSVGDEVIVDTGICVFNAEGSVGYGICLISFSNSFLSIFKLNVDNEGNSILALLNVLSVILEATHIVIPLYFTINLLVPG